MERYMIPLLDEGDRIIDTVIFEDNLTDYSAPDYVNYNGQLGLTRISKGKHQGELVIMYFFKDTQEFSYAEFINERDALKQCMKYNKLDLAYNLNLQIAEREVEVYDV